MATKQELESEIESLKALNDNLKRKLGAAETRASTAEGTLLITEAALGKAQAETKAAKEATPTPDQTGGRPPQGTRPGDWRKAARAQPEPPWAR